MIPILYDSTETLFQSNGIGRLVDTISDRIEEGRNGVFELTLTYPITGRHFSSIVEGNYIATSHDEKKDIQPFKIYRISRPIDGVVEINAHHISYAASDVIVRPITASSVSSAFSTIEANCMNTNPFLFWTDNTNAGTLDIAEPRSIRQILGGVRGSILDVFGGEYEFDGWTIKNHQSRGADNGVTIRYGKNLTDLTQETETLDRYNSIVPYWTNNEDGSVIYGSMVSRAGITKVVARAIDYTQDFQEEPTIAELEDHARAELEATMPWLPSENITVDFVALWQTEEYKDIAPLERVSLCDTVTVIYTDLGVQATAKVIKVVWDGLNERYTEIELGATRSSFASTILSAARNEAASMTKDFATARQVHAELVALETDLQTQIDQKIQTWYQATDPATAWTTADAKSQHNGDLWCYTGQTTSTYTQYGTYRYSYDSTTQTGTWEEYSATDELFDAIDGKTTIFYGSPTDTYTGVQANDYLVDPSTSKTYRWTGTDWLVVTDYTSEISTAVQTATSMITGGMGGYVVLTLDGNGKPTEILIMDTPDKNTAVNVWRWNSGGLGHSHSGYNGPFNDIAITQDGKINAAQILTGYLVADRIKGGTLTLGGQNNGNGVLQVLDASGNVIGTWDNAGITASGNFAMASRGVRTAIGQTTAGEGLIIGWGTNDTPVGWGSRYIQLHPNGNVIVRKYSDSTSYVTGNILSAYVFESTHTTASTFNLNVAGEGFELIASENVGSGGGGTTGASMRIHKKYFRWNNFYGGTDEYPYAWINEKQIRILNASGVGIDFYHGRYQRVDGNQIAFASSSSRRYKHDIKDLTDDELKAERLYDLPVRQGVYNDGIPLQYWDLEEKTIPMFIAEEVAEIYPSAVIRRQDNQEIESWDERRIIPPMLQLIKDQKKQLDEQAEKITALEARLAALEELIGGLTK